MQGASRRPPGGGRARYAGGRHRPSAPEEVRVTWEPGDVTIQEAEVSVTEGGGAQRTITVVLQLGDRP